jgi:hypothetical protein
VIMDRRELLKKAGLGSIALASIPTLVDALRTPARAQGRMNFHCVCVSAAGDHRLAIFGQGHLDPSKVGSQVEGSGGFFHFTATGTPPLPLVASGPGSPSYS